MTSSLAKELSRLELSFSLEVEQKLDAYIEELKHWSRKVNLTALEGRDLYRRLIAEPCWIGQKLQMSGGLLDLGSGNGSPGIPLYLARKLERADLVEARVKRAAFLRHVASQLRAPSLFIHRLRLEDMMTPPDGVEWITMQGVRPVAAVIATLQRLFAPTTHVVWITSGDSQLPLGTNLPVPGGNTVARVLRLDQF